MAKCFGTIMGIKLASFSNGHCPNIPRMETVARKIRSMDSD